MGADPAETLRTRATVGARTATLTATSAWISYVTSSLFGLQEGYWAAISAIVVMQSELQQTKSSGRDRFVGTAIGGVIAWGCASIWEQRAWLYAVAVALSVLVCSVARVGNAGRLAGVAVSVIVLIPRTEAIWRVALFRFLEVSWGIAVSLVVAALGARFLSTRAAK